MNTISEVNNRIAYTAVILNDRSRDRLIKVFSKLVPDDWEIIADHMTINMGAIEPEYERYIHFPVRLKVEDFAMDDKVAAVGVSGQDTKNEKAHITIAVNRQGGGKPHMSNNLTDWKPIKRPIMLAGKVEEIPLKFGGE